jgi:hypothetical protein
VDRENGEHPGHQRENFLHESAHEPAHGGYPDDYQDDDVETRHTIDVVLMSPP